jgi:4-amino-4-deoxychorismate lyase
VFETVLAVDRSARHLSEHILRLDRSAAMLELPAPPAEAWESSVETALARRPVHGESALRLVLTRGVEGAGTTAYVLADPLDPMTVRARAEGIRAVALTRGIDLDLAERAPWLLLGAKTTSYAVNMAAQRWARNHGADDAIFLANDGSVLEGPTSGVVAVTGRRLVSPPPSVGLLPSITVATMFAAARSAGWEAEFGRLTTEDLLAADGVWLVSSVRLAARVVSLDGQPLTGETLQAQMNAFARWDSPPANAPSS